MMAGSPDILIVGTSILIYKLKLKSVQNNIGFVYDVAFDEKRSNILALVAAYLNHCVFGFIFDETSTAFIDFLDVFEDFWKVIIVGEACHNCDILFGVTLLY
jgi:hypothetical protein